MAAQTATLPVIAQPDTTPVKRVLQAQKQVSQSVIRMGHLGLEKNNPDQYAVRVMDYILGGGFTSRLTQEIRSNQGLAYHAGSRFDIGRTFPRHLHCGNRDKISLDRQGHRPDAGDHRRHDDRAGNQ